MALEIYRDASRSGIINNNIRYYCTDTLRYTCKLSRLRMLYYSRASPRAQIEGKRTLSVIAGPFLFNFLFFYPSPATRYAQYAILHLNMYVRRTTGREVNNWRLEDSKRIGDSLDFLCTTHTHTHAKTYWHRMNADWKVKCQISPIPIGTNINWSPTDRILNLRLSFGIIISDFQRFIWNRVFFFIFLERFTTSLCLWCLNYLFSIVNLSYRVAFVELFYISRPSIIWSIYSTVFCETVSCIRKHHIFFGNQRLKFD